MAISTNGTVLTRVAGALYNVQMSNATYSEVASLDPSALVNTLYSRDFGTKTDLEVATTLIANLGLSAVTGLDNWVAAQLTAAGANKGAKVVSMLNDFAQMSTSDATYGAAVAAFNTKVDAALALSQTTGNAGGTFAAAGTPVVVGASFTLTTSVDDVNGGAGDDTIKGILGTSGTYGVGDNIAGGAGSDTLNLITNGSGIAGGLVALDSVETINVRLLSSAGEAVTLDATDWNGVETVTNASSLASTVLTVTGLAVTTDVKLIGQTTINAGFNNTTTASAAVNVILSDAGSGTTSSGYATLNVDANTTGLITSVAVDLQGTSNAAYLEGGASVKTYTVTGSGKGYLNTNDTITSFNAAAATGNLDVTFSAASDVVAVGGSGDDTFRFGANYTNSDSIDGGAGTDTVAITVGSFNRTLNTQNVENATVTFSQSTGGILSASGSTVTSYTLVAGTANAASLSQLANGSTFTLNDDSINGLTLDYVAGAASTTLNIGSAAGAVDVGALTITDVDNVNINAVGSGGVFGAATFDSDLDTLTLSVSGGEADLSIASGGAIALGGASTVTITSAGSAGVHFGSAITGNNLATLTVNAAGSDAADIVFGSASFVGTGISVITLNAYDAADISAGTLSVGNNATATSKDVAITVNVIGTGSDITIAGINTSGMGTVTLDINQAATGDVSIGAISLDVEASGSPTNLTLTDTSVIAGASAGIASITVVSGAAAQIALGSITVGANGQFSAGAINATNVTDVDVSDITITLGASADGFVGAITTTAGEIGDIAITLGANASANFGALVGSSIGSITIDSTGATGFADFNGASAGNGNFGGVEVLGAADGASVVMGTFNASAIGDVSVAGAGDFSMTFVATSVGSITSTQTKSGQFVIDLSGVTNAVEINLGRASNSVISGGGDDQIVLTAGTTANDTITYSAADGTDYISNFGAGAEATAGGADVIALSSGSWALHGFFGGSATAVESFTLGSAISSTAGAVSGSLIVLATSMANVTEVQAFLEQLDSVSAEAGDDFVVVWTDGGGDTTVSVVSFSGGVLASGVTIENLAVLTGVTPGAIVAANFDIV